MSEARQRSRDPRRRCFQCNKIWGATTPRSKSCPRAKERERPDPIEAPAWRTSAEGASLFDGAWAFGRASDVATLPSTTTGTLPTSSAELPLVGIA